MADKGGNGGDDVEQDFVTSAQAGVNMLASRIDEFPQVNLALLKAKLKSVKPQASTTPVFDHEGRIRAAVNFPKQNLISINSDRWSKIKDVKRKIALALHEYLGLLNLDL